MDVATRYHIPSVGVTWALRFRAGKNTYRTETKKAITVLYVRAYWLQRLKYVINPSFFPVVSYSEALYNLRFTHKMPTLRGTTAAFTARRHVVHRGPPRRPAQRAPHGCARGPDPALPHRRGALPTRPHARPHASQQRPDPKARASKRQHCRVSMPPYPLTIQPHRTNTT